MSSIFVAMIACIATCISVLAALIIHIIKYGEEKGAMRERVKRLEQEMIEQKDMREVVHELRGTVAQFGSTLDHFQAFLERNWTNAVPPISRR
ncbi:MAG: hypothetical protein IM561_08955 [Microcystis sp. M60BS1]|uniref:hypothetical protein n=1 Tax=unclassified Microcystis TaxID=2643300 RepID=UPI00257DDB12|nr:MULTISPECIES: hypothetical protein [unclassified Microcystis]MCA2594380.1 hypothetical protein [Microcystis sp. M38BS1]MCA6581496.1 hypothetical protein [Pseudanabaena sp. M34BS1SP1A06MG]MCA2510497.1 hypothetical protein [Microcystis sp. M60BS1]MCA2555783.1 hypothetical protein [Microcystis sp. M43BS1]MCA2591456.1 hypothetical protein [Microcystis sp. M31BS1]